MLRMMHIRRQGQKVLLGLRIEMGTRLGKEGFHLPRYISWHLAMARLCVRPQNLPLNLHLCKKRLPRYGCLSQKWKSLLCLKYLNI
jgi:hypothetical protein